MLGLNPNASSESQYFSMVIWFGKEREILSKQRLLGAGTCLIARRLYRRKIIRIRYVDVGEHLMEGDTVPDQQIMQSTPNF